MPHFPNLKRPSRQHDAKQHIETLSPVHLIEKMNLDFLTAVSSIVFLIYYTFCPCSRFFLMYLINKDETEHTGQVRRIMPLG